MTEPADRGKTPEKMTFPPDARMDKASHDPRNSYIMGSRSGHVFEFNDNLEAEHITLQHRTGSLIQFHPDGAISITAHKGQFTMVFGENRMYVTGAYDIVVDGDASLKVKGDYNVNVDGDYNTVVSGNMNTTVGKNQNTVVLDDQVVHAKNQTTKIAENTEHTTEGKTYIGSHAGMAVVCTGGNAEFASDQKVNLSSGVKTFVQSFGPIAVKAGTSMDINSKSGMKIEDPSGIDLNP
jgi:hypothetical protein